MNFRRESWDAADPLYKDAGELGMVVSVIGRAADFTSAKFKTMLDGCPERSSAWSISCSALAKRR